MVAVILSLLFRKPVDDVDGLSLDGTNVYRDEEGELLGVRLLW